MFGFRRKTSSSSQKPVRPAPTLSPSTEAELCAPVPGEMAGLSCLQDLIVSAQNNLDGIVKLDLVDGWIVDPVQMPTDGRGDFTARAARVLEKRQAASWSFMFVAAALQIARFVAKHNLEMTGGSSNLEFLDKYADNFLRAAPVLVSLSNRISCIRAIRGKGIVQEVGSFPCFSIF
jgi:hypothetical protein